MGLSFSKSTLWQMSWMFVKGNSGGPRVAKEGRNTAG